MRKLLILMLVFGLASVANGVLQISVNGDMDPEETEYTLDVGETLLLDIYTDSMIFGGAVGEGDWLLYCDTTKATISGGQVRPELVGLGNTLVIYDGKATGGWSPLPPDPQDGVGGAIFIFGTPIGAAPPAVIFDQILFQCEGGPGDVLVTLAHGTQQGADMVIDAEWDTVIIHQVPEPATIALLGLGSLFLMRRRRK